MQDESDKPLTLPDQKPARRTQADRREETRRALIGAARALFAEKGYAETGTPEIVKAAAVTRGALYHHFADKADLMRTVVRQEAEAVAKEINQDTNENQPPLEAFMAGARAYFTAMAVPGRARIMLLEGPAVLGLTEMAQIDRQTGGATLVEGLSFAQKHGALADVPIEALASLMSAAFDRAALALAQGAPSKDYEDAMKALLKGLFPRA